MPKLIAHKTFPSSNRIPLYRKPSARISARMKLIKVFGTDPEINMGKLLKKLDIKFEKQPRLKNSKVRPDFRIKGTNILLFCDGSFWHGRPSVIRNMKFNKNKKFWIEKLKENRQRDRRHNRLLKKDGWRVYRFWDTDLKRKPDEVRNRILEIISPEKVPNTKASAIDLFCGAGGMTYGLAKAGIKVRAGIDIDKTCKFAYEANNDSKFLQEDITCLGPEKLSRLYPKRALKILVGCAPCQPFSKHTQKNKNRKNDEKWSLLYAFGKLIERVQPNIVSMENVPQIVKQKVFSDFVRTLEISKYHVYWKSIYCPDYGIPQARRRLVLLASKFGPVEIIPPTHSKKEYKTVQAAIGKLEPICDGGVSSKDPLHRSPRLSDLNKRRIKQSKPGGTWLDWEEGLRAACHTKDTGESYSAVYARMEWGKVSPTITTQSCFFGTGRFGHPSQDRAISMRESALLQTFPKTYKFIDPKKIFSYKKIGTHIGNAVPVRLGEVVGRSIKKHIKNFYEK